MSVNRQIGAYASYVAWCRRLDIPAAKFADWYQHTATLEFANEVVKILSQPLDHNPGYEIVSIP